MVVDLLKSHSVQRSLTLALALRICGSDISTEHKLVP